MQPLPQSVHKELDRRFPKKFIRALEYVPFVDILVTRDSGLEISGTVIVESKEYGFHLDHGDVVCGCLDNFMRKNICKHLIAATVRAFHMNSITDIELLSLLQEKEKDGEQES